MEGKEIKLNTSFLDVIYCNNYLKTWHYRAWCEENKYTYHSNSLCEYIIDGKVIRDLKMKYTPINPLMDWDIYDSAEVPYIDTFNTTDERYLYNYYNEEEDWSCIEGDVG